MPRKKGKVEKDKKVKKKSCLNEKETLFYEQQILDNNKQLARVRTRNVELETEIEVLKEKLRQLEEDRSDVVAHLKRILQQKTVEAHELSERLFALEELRKEEQAAYKKKEDAMELEYRTMESSLSAEVKLVAGKLNALEDWRTARNDLMHKFEIQEKQLAEQEERHKQTLYEAEKSLIIGKAKMKKEMEERLNELAQSFREATNIRIADATHRAIRENIALNKELDAMIKVCQELEIKTKEHKEKERVLKLHASLFQTEAKMTLNKILKQNHLIDKLAEDHFKMTLEYGKLYRAEINARRNENIMEKYKRNCVDADRRIRILEQHIEQSKSNKEQVLMEVHANCQEIERLRKILHEAKRCVMKALQLQADNSEEDVCVSCYSSVKEELLHSLLDILGKHDIRSISKGKASSSQLETTENQYTFGSLGLVPSLQLSIVPGKELKEKQVEKVKHEEEHGTVKQTELLEDNKQQEAGQDETSVCLLETESSDIVTPQETVSTRSASQFSDIN